MKIFCITFGQVHTHRIDNTTLDCNCWIEIYASSETNARLKAFELFDNKWSMIYTREQFDDESIHWWYHRGCLLEFDA